MRNEEHLGLVPEHMHPAIVRWVESGEPHPSQMDAFLRALLCNDLHGVFQYGDSKNLQGLHNWMVFLHNYVPAACWGSPATVLAWHDEHQRAVRAERETDPGPKGEDEP
jgi:hypothetical protein